MGVNKKEHDQALHQKTSELPADLLRRQNMALKEAIGVALKDVNTEEARARRANQKAGQKTRGVFSALIAAAGERTRKKVTSDEMKVTPTKVTPMPSAKTKQEARGKITQLMTVKKV